MVGLLIFSQLMTWLLVSVLEVGTLKLLLLTPSFVSFMALLQLGELTLKASNVVYGMNRMYLLQLLYIERQVYRYIHMQL